MKNDRELDGGRIAPVRDPATDELHRARLACADAALRGVFPEDELADCLAMLGLLGGKEWS